MAETKKILTDDERLEIAVSLLDKWQLQEYIELCEKAEAER